MSEYRKQTTIYKDRDVLVDALVDMGYKREDIEIHAEAQQLYDYCGRPTKYTDKNGDKANVIVRRQHVGGAANDLGFRLDPVTGTYDSMISAYDSGKHNSTWLAGLKTNYNERGLAKTLKKQGFKYLGKKVVDGKIQVQYMSLGGK